MPYTEAELDRFRRLAAEGGLASASASRPGSSIDYDSGDDRAALMAKVDPVVDVGVGLVVLCARRHPRSGGAADASTPSSRRGCASTSTAGRSSTSCPTEYVGMRRRRTSTPWPTGVPDDVPIGWTGDAVVNDAITVADAEARAAALGGRPPSALGQLPGQRRHDGRPALPRAALRSAARRWLDALRGYLANPMVQPRRARLPLASIAAWLRGEDPAAAWAREADRLGWRVFAEACDGERPRALVAAARGRGGRPRLDRGGVPPG